MRIDVPATSGELSPKFCCRCIAPLQFQGQDKAGYTAEYDRICANVSHTNPVLAELGYVVTKSTSSTCCEFVLRSRTLSPTMEQRELC